MSSTRSAQCCRMGEAERNPSVPPAILRYFDRISEAPDAVPRLRRFILDLAVRGMLVEQDPEDEAAADLLKRIELKKALLVEEGRIKRQRKLPSIEANETPFGVPEHWQWVRLGAVCWYDAGTKTEPRLMPEDAWLLELEDIEKDSGTILKRLTVAKRSPRSTKSAFETGDVLYGKLRPYLNKVVVADSPGFSTTEIVAVRCYEKVSPNYLSLALRRPDFVDYVTRVGQGTKMPRLRTEDALCAPLPLPPLAEQHRIVAKVDELMALCDKLEVAQTKREKRRDRLVAAALHGLSNGDAYPESGARPTFEDTARFYFNHLPRLTTRPEHIQQLRQTILNLAVSGRLVPQDPNDEPAAELLKRIQDEKFPLDKARDRKREASLPPIDLDQAPFEFPLGWAWARFTELGTFGRGKSKHRPRNDPILFEGGTHLLIQTGDVARSNGVIKTYTNKYNDAGLAQSLKWPTGTLCITIAANIADSGILGFDACFPDSVVGFIPAAIFKDARYFEYFIRTAKANLLEFAPATAQKNINLEILNSVLIPLPPLAEQDRIVAKVDELMALCDELETQLTTTQADSRRLLEAVLRDALTQAA